MRMPSLIALLTLALLMVPACSDPPPGGSGSGTTDGEQPTSQGTPTTQPSASASTGEPSRDASAADATPASLNFAMTSLDGEQVHLGRYKGKVVLMVNTASRCGFTKQYAGLQKLHETYGPQGLAVLGFPANNFGNQEPGTDEEIATFCERNYGVSFDMFSKVSVKGEDMCELYRHLTSEQSNPGFGGEVKWNFEKFLLDRDGRVIGRFRSKVKPDSPELVKAIETALGV